jgi:hypothetical protein
VDFSVPRFKVPPSPRNLEIHRRHATGERAVDLAAEYCISWQRVHQIIDQVDAYLSSRSDFASSQN